jgi:hypothetical protein
MEKLSSLLYEIENCKYKKSIIDEVRKVKIELRKGKMYSILNFKTQTIGNNVVWYIDCKKASGEKEVIYIKKILLTLREGLFEMLDAIYQKAIAPDLVIQKKFDEEIEVISKLKMGSKERFDKILSTFDNMPLMDALDRGYFIKKFNSEVSNGELKYIVEEANKKLKEEHQRK